MRGISWQQSRRSVVLETICQTKAIVIRLAATTPRAGVLPLTVFGTAPAVLLLNIEAQLFVVKLWMKQGLVLRRTLLNVSELLWYTAARALAFG